MLGQFLPAGTALLVNFDVIRPIEQPVPGKGNFFRELLAKTGAGEKYQIFGQFGLDYANELYHGKITGLATTFTKPQGRKVVRKPKKSKDAQEVKYEESSVMSAFF